VGVERRVVENGRRPAHRSPALPDEGGTTEDRQQRTENRKHPSNPSDTEHLNYGYHEYDTNTSISG